jgi:hypothetical protein
LNLPFNSNGEATIRVRYDEAGSVRLFSRYTGAAANGDAGLVMNGQDDFVAKPRDFLLAVTGSGRLTRLAAALAWTVDGRADGRANGRSGPGGERTAV